MKIVNTSTSDGITFKGLLSEPAKKSKRIVIHIHGIASSFYFNDFYQEMHNKYSENGIAFLVGQNRGSNAVQQFLSTEGIKTIGNAYELFEDCVKDIQSWIDFAKSLGYEEIWLQGHSLGPSKIVHYLYESSGNDISGLILISPSEMNGLVHDSEGQQDFDILYPEAKKLVAQGDGRSLLSNLLWGEIILSANTFLNMFEDGSNASIFNFKRPELGWEKVESISIPVLAITGTKDDGIVPVMDPYISMDILKDRLKKSPRVSTIVLDGADHSFNGYEKIITSTVIEFVKHNEQ